MDVSETVDYRGYQIEIMPDYDAEDPRLMEESLGHMVCFHRRYALGDKHNFDSPQELMEFVERDDVIALPLFLYDHSLLAMRTSDFGDPWDSGMVGYIYVTKESIRKEYGIQRVTKRYREKAKQVMRSEVELYDAALGGRVYGFNVVDPEGDSVDSCWGFYGWADESGLLEEAKATIDYCREREQKEIEAAWRRRQEKLKLLIQNRVPLPVRQRALSECC